MRKESQRRHFDDWYSGKGKEVLFYDTPFLQWVMQDILNAAYDELGDLKGKRGLIYGSGVNIGPAKEMLSRGASAVHLIDISPQAVDLLQKKVGSEGLQEYVYADVMDCETTDFPDHFFDVIFGKAILHHLDLDKALLELWRIASRGAILVFIEPLGMNPLINLFRKLTPERRTRDEKPLDGEAISAVQKSPFKSKQLRSFTLLCNVGIFLFTILKLKGPSRTGYKLMKRADDALLKLMPMMQRFCWNTIISLKK